MSFSKRLSFTDGSALSFYYLLKGKRYMVYSLVSLFMFHTTYCNYKANDPVIKTFFRLFQQ